VQPAAKADSTRLHGADALSEAERIRLEYSRRAAALPPDYYAWHREVNQYFQASARRAATRLLTKAGVFPLADARIADIGCGHGQWLLEFLQWGAAARNLHGIDLIENRIAYTRERIADADLRIGDACRLPWPDGSMNLVTQFTVFSSILNEAVRRDAAREMLRVTRSGGHILWYDMRRSHPANRALRGIDSAEIHALFPGCPIRSLAVTLAPPVARAAVKLSWAAAFALEQIPLASTHLAALIQVPQ
jgi:SAM-dependent methyltransferase